MTKAPTTEIGGIGENGCNATRPNRNGCYDYSKDNKAAVKFVDYALWQKINWKCNAGNCPVRFWSGGGVSDDPAYHNQVRFAE